MFLSSSRAPSDLSDKQWMSGRGVVCTDEWIFGKRMEIHLNYAPHYLTKLGTPKYFKAALDQFQLKRKETTIEQKHVPAPVINN